MAAQDRTIHCPALRAQAKADARITGFACSRNVCASDVANPLLGPIQDLPRNNWLQRLFQHPLPFLTAKFERGRQPHAPSNESRGPGTAPAPPMSAPCWSGPPSSECPRSRYKATSTYWACSRLSASSQRVHQVDDALGRVVIATEFSAKRGGKHGCAAADDALWQLCYRNPSALSRLSSVNVCLARSHRGAQSIFG